MDLGKVFNLEKLTTLFIIKIKPFLKFPRFRFEKITVSLPRGIQPRNRSYTLRENSCFLLSEVFNQGAADNTLRENSCFLFSEVFNPGTADNTLRENS